VQGEPGATGEDGMRDGIQRKQDRWAVVQEGTFRGGVNIWQKLRDQGTTQASRKTPRTISASPRSVAVMSGVLPPPSNVHMLARAARSA
jgi:hypothetical protein